MNKINKAKILSPMTIDLTVTKGCNFACSYCFEAGKHESKHMSDDVYDKVLKFMRTHKYAYSLMIIGGEPSIAPNLNYFLKELKKEIENKTIYLAPINEGNSVYITNGYKIENIFNQLNDLDFWKKYFQIQISYDGEVLQNKYRKTLSDNLTSKKVLENFKELIHYNFVATLKSTINIYDFKHLPEIVDEFKDLTLNYNASYNITENKDSFKFMKKEEIKDEIEKYFTEVIKIENSFFQQYKKFITRWLNDSSLKRTPKCSAGVSMFHVDPEGGVQPCHLSLYNKNQFNYGSLDNFSTMKEFNKYKPYFQGEIEDRCKDCTAIYCLKCPMHNYNMSGDIKTLYNGIDDGTYKDTNEDKICFYYQEISKYIFYLKRKLNIW